MVEDMKREKLTDVRPKYEPPTVLRMSDPRAKAGADCVGSGSGDVADCEVHGNVAAVNCANNGITPGAGCFVAGVGF